MGFSDFDGEQPCREVCFRDFEGSEVESGVVLFKAVDFSLHYINIIDADAQISEGLLCCFVLGVNCYFLFDRCERGFSNHCFESVSHIALEVF